MDIRNLSLKWYIAVGILFALWCVHNPAKAEFSYFAEGGVSNYEKPYSGLWHQKDGGYHGVVDSTASAFRLGGEYGNDTAGIRLGYFDLGKYGTDAFANSNEDCANFSGPNAVDTCSGRVSQFKTEGEMRGFVLSVIGRTPPIVFGVRMTGEIGLSAMRQYFKLISPDQYQEKLHGGGMFLGVGAERKNFTLSVQMYTSNVGTNFNSNEFPSGVNYAYVVMVGFRG